MPTQLSNSLDVHIEISTISKNKENTSCCLVLCGTMCILIFTLPFIVADLYYAYSSDSCLAQSIPDLPTLGTWLAVSGWISISFILLTIIILTLLLNMNIQVTDNLLINCTRILFSMFNLAWMIVGSVIFWKYLGPNDVCSTSLSIYMWVRLIVGLLGIFSNCCTRNKDDALG